MKPTFRTDQNTLSSRSQEQEDGVLRSRLRRQLLVPPLPSSGHGVRQARVQRLRERDHRVPHADIPEVSGNLDGDERSARGLVAEVVNDRES